MFQAISASDRCERDGHRDAYKIYLRIHRGDEYFQFVSVVASGFALSTQDYDSVPPGAFWSAMAELAVSDIQQAIVRGDIPLEDRTYAYEVQPLPRDALARARDIGDVLAEGWVVAEFTVP